MMPDTELLQYIHKTADMGCAGLNDVIKYADSDMRKVLNGQLTEYEKLREEAATMLRGRKEEPNGAGAMAKISSEVMSAGQLMMDRSASKIAEMTIQGNNMGISKTIKHLHDYQGQDESVRALGEKLLATEEANVEQLKPFL